MLSRIDSIEWREPRAMSWGYHSFRTSRAYIGCGLRADMRGLGTTVLFAKFSILLSKLLKSSIGWSRLAKGFCVDTVLLIDLTILALRSFARASDLATESVTRILASLLIYRVSRPSA